jgi:hypothetical protein
MLYSAAKQNQSPDRDKQGLIGKIVGHLACSAFSRGSRHSADFLVTSKVVGGFGGAVGALPANAPCVPIIVA